MRDDKKWRISISQFQAIRANIPNLVSEDLVNEYHGVLDALSSASDEDLDSFRIPASEVKPRITGGQIGSGRYPGKVFYSKDNFCDDKLFRRKTDSLAHFLQSIEQSPTAEPRPDHPRDYWSMSNEELESLANKFHIGGYADQRLQIDRDIIISQLLKRDSAIRTETPVPRQTINVETMTGSVIQQGTSHSTANVNFQAADVRGLLEKIKDSVDQLSLTEAAKTQLVVDIQTVEPQLSSAHPRMSIVTECLHSMRTILEGAAGNAVASGLLYEITKLLPH